jgi:hypothetical protein
MSRENIETSRRGIDAFNRGGIEMALRFLEARAASPPAEE